MAHLLIIDLPDGNDTDLLQAAIARGDRYTFVSADLAAYRGQPAVQALLDRALSCIEVPGLDRAALARQVLAVHATLPMAAVLCASAAQHADTAVLAQRLGAPFLNPATAALLQDPLQWRQRLADRGLPQHGRWADIRAAAAGGAAGRVIACDSLTESGRHRLLGVHEAQWQPPPSRALRGSTFTPQASSARAHPRAGPDGIERYVGAVLDALDVDSGATHTELAITARGLQVVGIHAGLPGGRLPRLLGYALGRSLHADVIALHCGQPLPVGSGAAPRVAVLRTLSADRAGVLDEVVLPPWQDPAIRCVELLRQPGQDVTPPLCDADNLGCVMVCGPSRADAEDLADRYVARTLVRLRPAGETGAGAAGLESAEPAVAPAGVPAPARTAPSAALRPWSQRPTVPPPPQPLQASPPPAC